MITTTIPALTIWQPWASLVAVGAERYETRSWPAPQTLQPGDLLAIHAARRATAWDKLATTVAAAAARVLMQAGIDVGSVLLGEDPLPKGEIVAVCQFCGCYPTEQILRPISAQERMFGDWSPGRYAWELRVVIDLRHRPVEARGRQRVWQWEPPQWVLDELRMRGLRP